MIAATHARRNTAQPVEARRCCGVVLGALRQAEQVVRRVAVRLGLQLKVPEAADRHDDVHGVIAPVDIEGVLPLRTPAIASSRVSDHRVPLALVPPTRRIRSQALERFDLLTHLISTRIAVLTSFGAV